MGPSGPAFGPREAPDYENKDAMSYEAKDWSGVWSWYWVAVVVRAKNPGTSPMRCISKTHQGANSLENQWKFESGGLVIPQNCYELPSTHKMTNMRTQNPG